jgi:heme/copper-type cytochrome/quinol oxidase subunit 2
MGYTFVVADLGKVLVIFGVLIVIVGIGLLIAGRMNLPVGRLPGDIMYRSKHTTFYFPLATSIILSVVLSLVLYLVGRFRAK